jgi:hypothetical protein
MIPMILQATLLLQIDFSGYPPSPFLNSVQQAQQCAAAQQAVAQYAAVMAATTP